MEKMKQYIYLGSILLTLISVSSCGDSHEKNNIDYQIINELPDSQSGLEAILNNIQLKSTISKENLSELSVYLCQINAYAVSLNIPNPIVKFDSSLFKKLDARFYNKSSWQMIRLQARNRQGIEVFVLAAYIQQACEN